MTGSSRLAVTDLQQLICREGTKCSQKLEETSLTADESTFSYTIFCIRNVDVASAALNSLFLPYGGIID